MTVIMRSFQKFLDEHRCNCITSEEELEQYSTELQRHAFVVASFCSDTLTNRRAKNDKRDDEVKRVKIEKQLYEQAGLQRDVVVHGKKETKYRSIPANMTHMSVRLFNCLEEEMHADDEKKDAREKPMPDVKCGRPISPMLRRPRYDTEIKDKQFFENDGRALSDKDITAQLRALIDLQTAHLRKYDHSSDSCNCVYLLRREMQTRSLHARALTVRQTAPNCNIWIDVLRADKVLDDIKVLPEVLMQMKAVHSQRKKLASMRTSSDFASVKSHPKSYAYLEQHEPSIYDYLASKWGGYDIAVMNLVGASDNEEVKQADAEDEDEVPNDQIQLDVSGRPVSPVHRRPRSDSGSDCSSLSTFGTAASHSVRTMSTREHMQELEARQMTLATCKLKLETIHSKVLKLKQELAEEQ